MFYRRSGIRLNTAAFDAISSPGKTPISPIAPRTRTNTNYGAAAHDNNSHIDSAITATHNAYPSQKLSSEPQSDSLCVDSAHTTPYTVQHNAYHALQTLHTIPSGRSSPEYKDNEPGSIYAPLYNTAPYTSSDKIGGYNIGRDMTSLPATPSMGTYEVHHTTPYHHTTNNNDTSTDTTPYNQATSAYNYIHTPGYTNHQVDTSSAMNTPYRMDRNDSFDSTFSSPPKVHFNFISISVHFDTFCVCFLLLNASFCVALILLHVFLTFIPYSHR